MKSYKIILFLFLIQYTLLTNNKSLSQDIYKLNKQVDSLNSIFGEKNTPKELRAQAYIYLARNEEKLNHLLNALYFYKKASELYDIKIRKKELADVYVKIGYISETQYDFENALEYNFRAKQLFYEIKDNYNEVQAMENIARIYGSRGLARKGLKYFLLTRNYYLSDPAKYKHNLFLNSINLGNVFYELNKSDSAFLYYKNALSYIDYKTKARENAAVYNNIGTVFYINNNLDSAYYYYLKSSTFMKGEKKDFYGGVITLTNLGEIKVKQKKYDEALEYYNKAMKLIEKQKAYDHLLILYLDLKEFYKKTGNYKTSIEYFEKYKNLNDSMTSAEKLNKFAEVEKKYELMEWESKISLMTNEKELVVKKNRIKTIWQYILISGMILFVFLGLLIFRNLRVTIKNKELTEKLHEQEKKQLETELVLRRKDLENKNKDMEHFALRIIEKNEFIENLEGEIRALQGTEKDKQRLLKITNTIRNNISLEKEVFDIENKINETYEGFFRKLEDKHPLLSKTEKKLCSLIVLNLENKDIASLLNITMDSVKKGRYRLRKKLELRTEDDISDYLKVL